MLRLEANDLSKAEYIIRHPGIFTESGEVPPQHLRITGSDRAVILAFDDDEPVGYIAFVFSDHKTAECGIGFLKDYRGVFAKSACELALQAMFFIGFEWIVFKVKSTHVRSLSGARTLGFVRREERAGVVTLELNRTKCFQMHPQMRQ